MKKIFLSVLFGFLIVPFNAFAAGPYNTTKYNEGKAKESLLKSLSLLSDQAAGLRVQGRINYAQETSFQSVIVGLMQSISADKDYLEYVRSDRIMPFPIITSATATSGSTGDSFIVNGKNLAGFEGDLYVLIENKDGRKALMQGVNSNQLTTTEKIVLEIPEKACEQDVSYSGLPCPQYLVLTPGVYKISTNPWGNKSNTIIFEILGPKINQTTAKVFLVDSSGEDSRECNVNFVPLSYDVSRTSPLRDSLNLLLTKTSFGESGLLNPMSSYGFTLDDVSIKDNIATIKLSGREVSGYCTQYGVWNQVNQTARQFSTVTKTDVYINGRNLNFEH